MVKDASNSVFSLILVLIDWLKLNCFISFGENGESNSDPRGRPRQVIGTLKGLPPWLGWIFLDKKGRAGYEGDCGLSLTLTADPIKVIS